MEIINLPFIIGLVGLILILLIINFFIKPTNNSNITTSKDIPSKVIEPQETNTAYYPYFLFNSNDNTAGDCNCHGCSDDLGSGDCGGDCGSDCGGGGCD